MRNYCRYFLVSGNVDDGSGGSIPTTGFFMSQDQASAAGVYGLPWQGDGPITNQYVYIWLQKDLILQHLGVAYGATVISPTDALLNPPTGSLISPRDALDEQAPDDFKP